MSSEASNRGGALAVLSGRVFAGLDNLGNTCFMNAALQCLMSSAPLCIYFMLGKHSPHICESSPTKGRMALAFADLLAKARPESVRARGSVSPQTIRQLVGRYASHFSEYMQHDCQEFLRYFLDSLSEDLYTKDRARPDTLSDAIYNRLNALDQSRYMWNLHLHRQSSVVVDYFGGQLESKIVCSVCGGTSRTFDPVLDISLPLPSSSDSSSQTVGEVHLQDCLEEYTREEMLDGVQCDRCGKRTPCAKSLRVMRRPHVLILHLKRFRYTEYSREKLNTAVAYPLQGLDLRPYMSTESSHTADATYDLYSVVHHVGSLSGGHYTATCLSHSDGHWYDMNDEEVVRLDSPRDKNIGGPSVSTYVLLYKLNSRKRAGSANSTSNSALMHTR
jgi:ubiquitin carboxyl-terminal hydrolase 2/21